MAIFSATDLACLRGQTLVFSGLDFEIRSGELLVLKGPNGSGKSSFIRQMAGLIPVFSGQLCWDSAEIKSDPAAHRDRLAYIGHANALKAPLTVRENLRFWAEILDARDNLDDALDCLDLRTIADIPARILSAGQARRANLARLALCKRALWLLDEPMVGLDQNACKYLEQMISDHRAGGGMAVLSTHSDRKFFDCKKLDIGSFSRLVNGKD